MLDGEPSTLERLGAAFVYIPTASTDEVQALKLIIDSSSDGVQAAYACLILDPPTKPRLIYGTGRSVSCREVEAWGIKRAVRRTNRRLNGARPLIVYTDSLSLVQSRRFGNAELHWLSRNEPCIEYVHRIANSLRRSMEVDRPTGRKPKKEDRQLSVPGIDTSSKLLNDATKMHGDVRKDRGVEYQQGADLQGLPTGVTTAHEHQNPRMKPAIGCAIRSSSVLRLVLVSAFSAFLGGLIGAVIGALFVLSKT